MQKISKKCKPKFSHPPSIMSKLAKAESEFVTTQEACDILNCTIRRVHWLLETNEIAHTKLGHRFLVSRSSVEALAERERQAATPTPTEAPENVNA